MKPEAYVETYLIKKAKQHNCLCYKFVSPSNAGVPDRIVIGYDHVVFIELKAAHEKPRRLQEAVIENMKAHGATVLVLNTRAEIDDFFEILSKGGQDDSLSRQQ